MIFSHISYVHACAEVHMSGYLCEGVVSWVAKFRLVRPLSLTVLSLTCIWKALWLFLANLAELAISPFDSLSELIQYPNSFFWLIFMTGLCKILFFKVH